MGLDLFLGLEVSLGGLLVFYEITFARGAPLVVTWAAAGLVTNSILFCGLSKSSISENSVLLQRYNEGLCEAVFDKRVGPRVTHLYLYL